MAKNVVYTEGSLLDIQKECIGIKSGYEIPFE
jgi:hypothetical protein